MTPAHDPTDFEIAQRHNLPLIKIMDDKGVMNEHAGPYAGLDRNSAVSQSSPIWRRVVNLSKQSHIPHAVGHCQRCKTIVEPVASRQWFVDMKPLAKPAIEALKNGTVKIVPDRY